MSTPRNTLAFLFASAVAIVAATYGCSDDPQGEPPPPDAGNPTRRTDSGTTSDGGGDATTDGSPAVTYKARATIAPTSLDDAGAVNGTIDFTETNGTVTVAADIKGATPGMHAVHIHEGTSCADIDGGAALAAGNHWNPLDAGHGLPTSASHHAGDFGNVSIDGAGNGTLNLEATGWNVQPNGGALSAIGHAVIVHQGTDDGTSQPSGNAGGRAGCGIIQAQ